jgi:ABC-type glycerol-3-phosphate transport system substrate-binding protein
MYYNKDMFDQAGVAYPEIGWTWNDFVNALTALSDPSIKVYGYGTLLDSLDALAFIVGHGGRFFDDPVNPTRIVFDDPPTVEALEWYADLIHERGFVATDKQAYDQALGGNLQSAVYLDKIAIWPGWISERGGGGGINTTWIAEWKMRWGMAPFPHDAQPATVTVMAGYFVSAQTASPEACWQWISFLSEQMPHQLTPARRSLTESAGFERLVGDEVAAVARASMEDATFLSPDLAEVGDDMNTFFAMVDHIISGRLTVTEAVAWAEEQSAGED